MLRIVKIVFARYFTFYMFYSGRFGYKGFSDFVKSISWCRNVSVIFDYESEI